MARIQELAGVSITPWEDCPEWKLCLQYCRFPPEGDLGYRFIYRVDNKLRPQRGGARIPSRKHAELLWAKADLAGWAHLNGENGELPE